MIYETGSFEPTKLQIKQIRKAADDSFLSRLPDEFGPLPHNLSLNTDKTNFVALNGKCVEAHTDDWVGDGPVPRR